MTTESNWIESSEVSYEREFYSEIYEDETGLKAQELSDDQLADWLNNNLKLEGSLILNK